MSENNDITIKSFSSSKKWKEWLMLNFATYPNGIWLQIYKKDTGIKTITYEEALDEALCFGWIDSQKKKYDEKSWLQKFTPRRSKSIWSKRNREKVALLIKEKRMQPSGLLEIKAAQKDGRWDKAYESPSQMEIPSDFLAKLVKDQKAHEFFKTLNKTNLYAISWRLQTAKTPETREKRMKVILEMMKNQQKLH
ncbi:YdeI/OmpD-associated family protein [Leptospira meyeri]|uniref:YdeI/OmpD-associated family protein n=1 Tax=Leptospira meyeri TaxID=29508 RepID=UPI000C2B2C86|nr:YdeI/OmpD-associated family protein [Leptospira meyeri]PKA24357.1 bacteriocin-protection protein, YdeI/OmpD-associated family [Leptospira sp. mixed culture ATI2-C-A1]MCW7488240.1 YdeI/OmpD-associated family protein [Leptospira meyeri]PJZ81471.1 bacteriocin-protection protein, YdeI/OmpD-associated family [Leptospira meyeri]PJZ96973.1 bacteriocin-protection protein, YdeI/OmpD-associated family [Leptospira meyeri]PKA13101.1 bacteriocin-protection protein, YdeI/OmpD-associated family [Leptospir